jgi:hypothetical protein
MYRRGKGIYKSGLPFAAIPRRLLSFEPKPLGQLCPPHCPQPANADPLGEPLSIREAAELIGCSVWTVRRKYLPIGIPHFRVGATGKLIFYKSQLIRWLINRQKKGGFL